MLKRLFIIGIILFFSGSSFAASAGNPSDPTFPKGSGIANMEASGLGPFKLGFDADLLIVKELEGASGTSDAEIEGQWYLLRIGYTVADRFEPYVRLGMSHLKASWKEGSAQLKTEGESALALGIGGKALIYEIPEHKIRFSLDGQYRYTDPDIDKAAVNIPDRSISATEFKVTEWQIAGIISMVFPINYDSRDPAAICSVVPYVGFGYFDSKTESSFTYAGTKYDLGDAENDDKFLFVTGCDINSPNNITFNAEGRWVGETAASGGLTLKF